MICIKLLKPIPFVKFELRQNNQSETNSWINHYFAEIIALTSELSIIYGDTNYKNSDSVESAVVF